jgi:hypothetical protein
VAITRILLCALAAGFLAPLQSINGSPVRPEGIKEEISGNWSDACPCSVPCPCWRTGRANGPHCWNVQVFQLEKPLTRRETLILVGSSEGYWAPSQYILYTDKTADDSGIRKLSGFFEANYGVDVRASRRAEIRDESSRGQLRIEIPGILKYYIEPSPATPLSGTVRDYLYSLVAKPAQWKTRLVKYQSRESESTIEYKRTSSLIGELHLDLKDLQRASTSFTNQHSGRHTAWNVLATSGVHSRSQPHCARN